MYISVCTGAFLASMPLVVQAWNAPAYDGFNLTWQDTFTGSAGSSPNTATWNIITGYLGVNSELETYTSSSANLQLSGGNTLQIVPWEASDGSWTSGRVESVYTFTPAAGVTTFAEADIRFGSDATNTKQGMWPAFWMLGDSMRHGTAWPECGEIDALETVDGNLIGYGTLHCDLATGGACNDPTGISSSVVIPDQSWHTWRVQFDRTSDNWETETISWYMDGQEFASVAGSVVGDESSWAALCHSPLYFILNVAVGGSWVTCFKPGAPNANTEDGYGAMMEVAYVAVYSN